LPNSKSVQLAAPTSLAICSGTKLAQKKKEFAQEALSDGCEQKTDSCIIPS